MNKLFLTVFVFYCSFSYGVEIHKYNPENEKIIHKDKMTNEKMLELKKEILKLPPEESFKEIKKRELYFRNGEEIYDYDYDEKE